MANGGWQAEVKDWIISIGIALVLAFFIRTFIVELYLVSGPSMEPTLQNDNRLVISKFIYRFRIPERGEVIVFKYPKDPDRDFVKRVIGLPGDKIAVKSGVVYVNGVAQHENYMKRDSGGHYIPKENLLQFDEYPERLVPEGTIFAMGDNRYNSLDSRDFRVGFIPLDMIKGKALLVFWPLSDWKTLP